MDDVSSFNDFKQAIIGACRQDTAMSPQTWSQDNPTDGHCGLAACLVQEVYGGEIVVAHFNGPHGGGTHFFNILPNDERFDATSDQFGPCVTFTPPLSASNDALRENTDTFLNERGGDSMRKLMFGKESFTRRYEAIKSRLPEMFPPKQGPKTGGSLKKGGLSGPQQ